MELSGEEKKLQALFSELKTADEQAAPQFGATWNRAQSAPRKIHMFNPAFAAVALLLVFALVAFAVWSRYSRTTSSPQPIIAQGPQNPGTSASAEPPASPKSATPLPQPKTGVVWLRRKKVTSARNVMIATANRKLQKDAKSIASWTSPTSALLESPSDEIFGSLPELNQSATQLKSFLPSRSN
jgi:hypothetical protein